MRHCNPLTALLLATALPIPAAAGGLWDAGLLQGGWRSELPRPSYGTASDPLVFETACRFPGVEFALCPAHPGIAGPPARVFSQSHWQDQRSDSEGRYWVVGANAEPAGDAACNSGPPNQSEAIAAPFEDVFGLRFGPPEDGRAPWRNEWLLAVDLAHRPRQLADRPDCVTRDYIPYLGVGIASERGGGGAPLARFEPGRTGPLLRLGLRLVDSNAEVFDAGQPIPPDPRGQHAGIWLEAHWGETRRWIWLALFSSFEHPDEVYAAPWNWALRESFHAPGADIVVASLPALRRSCPQQDWPGPSPAPAAWQEGVRHEFVLDIGALFDCLGARFQQPPPSAKLELTGVHGWIEVGLRERDGLPGFSAEDYDSRLGMAFDGFDLLPPELHGLAEDPILLTRLAGRFGGREPEAAAARVAGLDPRLERGAAIADLLADAETAEHGLLPILLQHLLLDAGSAAWLGGQQRRLAAGSLSLEGAAHQILRAQGGGRGLPMEPWVEGLQSRFLVLSGLDRGAARARSPWLVEAGKWQRLIALGRTTPGALAEFLARELLALPAGRRLAEVDLLHHAFLGRPAAPAELARWRTPSASPQQLAEQLYYGAEFRASVAAGL
ncbi:hypothetical protein [Pseudomarimonas salicorniae]|uniref:Uncharacterized protein n=1 Tax=Pseudomarimonas salicorniae TaxID=2933270 RepID=A0ABT0GDS9_9GAMM|nr:hypothetical protein [Lysobacter sp. CAU 1642]MCK7592688.1 hypothetical protein [Lysobacter sp. CAU 1642]